MTEQIWIHIYGSHEIVSKICKSIEQDENVLKINIFPPEVLKIKSSEYVHAYIDYIVDKNDL